MMKRGLEWKEQPVPESKAPVEMPDDDHLLVLLREYEDIGKAAEDRHALREASVKAYFFDDNQAASEGPITWTGGDGVKLQVRATDLAIGLELLAQRQETVVDQDIEAEQAQNQQQDSGRPVVLRSYRDVTEAMVDRSKLESAGIKCILYDDNLFRLDWFVSNAVGGVKLVVPQNEAAEALKLLDDVAETS
jgi:hypothetical protein